jgi:hypothetical protein
MRIPMKNTGPLEGILAVINNDSVPQLTEPLQSGPFEFMIPKNSEVHSRLLRSNAILSKKSYFSRIPFDKDDLVPWNS